MKKQYVFGIGEILFDLLPDGKHLGGAMAWFYRGLGGIVPCAENPGFTRFSLQPVFPRKVEWVNVSYQSVCGKIVSRWERKEGMIHCFFKIPDTSRAEIILPGIRETDVSGNVEFRFSD